MSVYLWWQFGGKCDIDIEKTMHRSPRRQRATETGKEKVVCQIYSCVKIFNISGNNWSFMAFAAPFLRPMMASISAAHFGRRYSIEAKIAPVHCPNGGSNCSNGHKSNILQLPLDQNFWYVLNARYSIALNYGDLTFCGK